MSINEATICKLTHTIEMFDKNPEKAMKEIGLNQFIVENLINKRMTPEFVKQYAIVKLKNKIDTIKMSNIDDEKLTSEQLLYKRIYCTKESREVKWAELVEKVLAKDLEKAHELGVYYTSSIIKEIEQNKYKLNKS